MEKELEKMIGEIFVALLKTLGKMVKGVFFGIKKLKKKNNIIVFLCMFLVTAGALLYKKQIFDLKQSIYIRYLIYYVLLCFPGIYLIILGLSQDALQEKYKKIFKEIGFYGQNNQYPFFVGKRMIGKKVILVFKSNIPLPDWKKAKDKLENGLDCNIVIFQEGKSKKIVELTTVPSSCQIPEQIDWSDEYISPEDGVMVVGQDALGTIKFDLNRTANVLIAGEIGSGKSVLLRCCLWQMIKKGAQVYMIDFKGGVEFGKQYEQYGEVITDRERALAVLTELSKENARRLKLFRELEVKNLKQYIKKTGENLHRIGVFCDEIGEMMDKKGASSKNEKMIFEQLEGIISSMARLTRATGINLFLGVQRPDANVLTGQIKNNIPVRISGRFADKSASEIVLGNTMAADLPDIKGRFICKIGNDLTIFQAYYFDDDAAFDTKGSYSNQGKTPNTKIFARKKEKKAVQTDAPTTSKQDNLDNIKPKIQKPAKSKPILKKEEVTTAPEENAEDGMDYKIDWEPMLKKKDDELDLNYSNEGK